MKNRLLKDSFSNAFSGIFQAFKTEKNIRYHSLSAIGAIVFAFVLKLHIYEWVMVIMTITLVFVAEMLNTAVEYAIDMVCGDQYNEIAKYAKDIAAGATLIAAFGSIILFILLYLPKILKLF